MLSAGTSIDLVPLLYQQADFEAKPQTAPGSSNVLSGRAPSVLDALHSLNQQCHVFKKSAEQLGEPALPPAVTAMIPLGLSQLVMRSVPQKSNAVCALIPHPNVQALMCNGSASCFAECQSRPYIVSLGSISRLAVKQSILRGLHDGIAVTTVSVTKAHLLVAHKRSRPRWHQTIVSSAMSSGDLTCQIYVGTSLLTIT